MKGQATLDGPAPVRSKPQKPRLAAWIAEQRAFTERVERVEAYLRTPEGEAALAAAVAELRACPECHPPVGA